VGLASAAGAATARCHTAVAGEPCHHDVMWAMTDGIYAHPEWYTGLTKRSTFEAFQAEIFKINRTTCPLPCNPAVAGHGPKPQSTKPAAVVKDQGQHAQEATCHTAVEGEKCHDHVLSSKPFILAHPILYPDISATSSFEDFQELLHKSPNASCPRPCHCHTAVVGETCHHHVQWAKTDGIRLHADWYEGLTEDSSFEQFQAYLHKDSKMGCPRPCSRKELVGADETKATISKTVHQATSEVEKADKTAAVATTPAPDLDQSKRPCHNAVKGDVKDGECYKHVMWAMETGINTNPEWYPGLNKRSSFEDFQTVLTKNPEVRCPRPCPCHTAVPGEKCHESVAWVLRTGVTKHPSWYEGLSVDSRFEEVQARLQEDTNSTCQMPCTPPNWGSPSLFCFSVFRSTGYEPDLMRGQLSRNAGIFACDQFAVLADAKLSLATGVETIVIPPNENVGISKDGTAANTMIFMQAWSMIYLDFRFRSHDWTIKVDPDAVVLPGRLRNHLAPHTGKTVYVKNCNKYPGAPGWPMMYGSLEAFTRSAMETYFRGAERCKNDLQWQAWGEDLFMASCLDMLGVGSVFDGNIVGDNVCTGSNCGDGAAAAYHPFKSKDTWTQCYDQAVR